MWESVPSGQKPVSDKQEVRQARWCKILNSGERRPGYSHDIANLVAEFDSTDSTRILVRNPARYTVQIVLSLVIGLDDRLKAQRFKRFIVRYQNAALTFSIRRVTTDMATYPGIAPRSITVLSFPALVWCPRGHHCANGTVERT